MSNTILTVYRNASIKTKTQILLFAAAILVSAALLANFIWQNNNFKKDVTRDVLAEFSVLAKDFADIINHSGVDISASTTERLNALDNIQNIYLFNRSDDVVFTYNRESGTFVTPPEMPLGENRFEEDYLHGFLPVSYQGVTYGKLYYHSSIEILKENKKATITISIIFLLAFATLIFFISKIVDKMICTPIIQLSKAINNIEKNFDTPIKLERVCKDEIALLYDGTRTLLDEVKQTHITLQKSNEVLETRVNERTRELTIAKNEAEDAARAKAFFLANMSHEIRTPMNGVLGMLQLLRNSQLSVKQKQDVETAYRSGEFLLVLLNDILDLSKIEAGKLTLEYTDFNLRLAVEDTLNLLTERATNKGLQLIIEIDPALPELVNGDPTRTRQILMNLVGNAIKFTNRGEVVVTLTVREINNRGPVIHFSVRDTGIGISDKIQSRIFDFFSQGDDSTTRYYGGTGLGLSISSQLAKLMDSKISVTSTVGHGSEFTFLLQMRNADASLLTHSASQVTPHIRLLLIDKNPTSRSALSRTLENWHFLHDQVDNTTDALNLLHQAQWANCPYNIVVLDMDIPGIDSTEFVNKLKQDDKTESIDIILLTSSLSADDKRRLDDSGVKHFISKPVHQDCIYEAIIKIASTNIIDINTANNGSTSPAENRPATNRGISILVAEDNLINQRVVSAMLEKFGATITLAINGAQVLELMQNQQFDIILMDCQMPFLNGYEATAKIRQLEGNQRHTTIIAMTANAMQGDREFCIKSGMDDYISKPLEINRLEEVIHRWTQDLQQA